MTIPMLQAYRTIMVSMLSVVSLNEHRIGGVGVVCEEVGGDDVS